MPKRSTSDPKREEKEICNSKNQLEVKEDSCIETKNNEDVSMVSSSDDDDSFCSTKTVLAPTRRQQEALTNSDSDSTEMFRGFVEEGYTDGKEGRYSHSKDIMPEKLKKPRTPPNNPPTPSIKNIVNFGSNAVLKNSLPSSAQLNKNVGTPKASKSEYPNHTHLSTPCPKGLSAIIGKRDISVLKKPQSRMLNSQVTITPCSMSSSTFKRSNAVEVKLQYEQKKDIYALNRATRNGIHTIDLTRTSPKRRRLNRSLLCSREQVNQRPAGRTNNTQFPSPAASQNNRKDCGDARAPPYVAIPVVNLQDPTVASKLVGLGIRSAIPLSELYSTRGPGNGVYMVPIVNMASARSPAACNIDGIGASSLLPLGQLMNIASNGKK